jgi:predicted metal-dependent hydrolase
MQFEFNLDPAKRSSAQEFLALGERRIAVVLVRNLRARRYVLRLRKDGAARVTIPRGGSVAEAWRFAERNKLWLDRQLQKASTQLKPPTKWRIGTEILFRGDPTKIEALIIGEANFARFGGEMISVRCLETDLRPIIEKHLWKLASRELPSRVLEFAALHKLPVRRVTVRNQKSRWGSCSRRGTISLNWRLIQATPFVRDYIIFHELMHLRQMNHSPRFWREVESVCPDYKCAEQWLKKHSTLLH